VDAIGSLANTSSYHPEVDLPYAGLTMRLMTYEVGGLSEHDVEIARSPASAAGSRSGQGASADEVAVLIQRPRQDDEVHLPVIVNGHDPNDGLAQAVARYKHHARPHLSCVASVAQR
jgi:hypothetical protein